MYVLFCLGDREEGYGDQGEGGQGGLRRHLQREEHPDRRRQGVPREHDRRRRRVSYSAQGNQNKISFFVADKFQYFEIEIFDKMLLIFLGKYPNAANTILVYYIFRQFDYSICVYNHHVLTIIFSVSFTCSTGQVSSMEARISKMYSR